MSFFEAHRLKRTWFRVAERDLGTKWRQPPMAIDVVDVTDVATEGDRQPVGAVGWLVALAAVLA